MSIDEFVEEAIKSPMFSCPCYICEYKEKIVIYCDECLKCGLWLDWAKKHGII